MTEPQLHYTGYSIYRRDWAERRAAELRGVKCAAEVRRRGDNWWGVWAENVTWAWMRWKALRHDVDADRGAAHTERT